MATIGFIGLGNMGGPMAANLVRAGHTVCGFDLSQAAIEQARKDGCDIAASAVEAFAAAEENEATLEAEADGTPQCGGCRCCDSCDPPSLCLPP